MANFRWRAALALIAGVLAPVAAHGLTLSWPGGHAAAHRFTFPWAAHVDERSGNYAVQQFVEKELTPGLPMAEAVAKARAAESSCHGDARRGGGVVTCRYEIGDANDMAPLGQEIWTLTLTPGPDGKLATAAIDRTRAGLGGEEGDRAVFHWRVGE
jgi:hypothetical protein